MMAHAVKIGLLSLVVGLVSWTYGPEQPVDKTGIKFFEGTLEEAKTLAKKEGKLIFVDAYTTWCGPCKWMAANTFTDAEIATYFNENFINVKVDCERNEGPQFAREYRIRAYPTLLIIDGEGKERTRSLGAKKVPELMAFGKNIP